MPAQTTATTLMPIRGARAVSRHRTTSPPPSAGEESPSPHRVGTAGSPPTTRTSESRRSTSRNGAVEQYKDSSRLTSEQRKREAALHKEREAGFRYRPLDIPHVFSTFCVDTAVVADRSRYQAAVNAARRKAQREFHRRQKELELADERRRERALSRRAERQQELLVATEEAERHRRQVEAETARRHRNMLSTMDERRKQELEEARELCRQRELHREQRRSGRNPLLMERLPAMARQPQAMHSDANRPTTGGSGSGRPHHLPPLERKDDPHPSTCNASSPPAKKEPDDHRESSSTRDTRTTPLHNATQVIASCFPSDPHPETTSGGGGAIAFVSDILLAAPSGTVA